MAITVILSQNAFYTMHMTATRKVASIYPKNGLSHSNPKKIRSIIAKLAS